MATKVTDKGIIYPDGTEQTTAAFGSGKEAVVLNATTITPQEIPSSVLTPLALTADHDTNNAFDGTKFTPSVAGWYHFTGTFGINGPTTDFNSEVQTAIIRKNNDELYYGVQLPISLAYSISQVDATIYLNGTTDYVELIGYQASGVMKVTNPGLVKPRLQAFLITGQSTGGSGGKTVAFSYKSASNVTGADGAYVTANLGIVVNETGSYSNGTTGVVIPEEGYYQLNGSLFCNSATPDNGTTMGIRVNGSEITKGNSNNVQTTGTKYLTASITAYLKQGDVVTLSGRAVGGGTQTIGNAKLTGFLVSGGSASGDAKVVNLSANRNLIINGDMRIDQRNAGASVTPSTGTYTLDRYRAYQNATGKFTVQQSSTAPDGFENSVQITSTSAHTVASGELFLFMQYIEGYNVAHLDYGTSNAQTITISFWVRSSLTGTFGGALLNQAENRNYPFTYDISSADTWEQKSITIAGDTTGTWLKTNGLGLQVNFSLGMGSTYSGTAGAWANGAKFSATGATSVVSTSGATWYMTGLQVEKGDTEATPFEHVPYDVNLQRCQRYYETNSNGLNTMWSGYCTDGNTYYLGVPYKVTKRASPTVTFSHVGSSSFPTTGGVNNVNTFGFVQYRTANATNPQGYFQSSFTAYAEL